MIKIAVPQMTCDVVDRAIQAHGGMGVCQDTPLASFWTHGRIVRIADGPDEVHMYQLGRNLVKERLLNDSRTTIEQSATQKMKQSFIIVLDSPLSPVQST